MVKLNVERTLLKAASHKRNGEMDEARKCYDSVLELFPGNIRAKQGLAKLSQPKPDILAEENPSDETLDQLISLFNKGKIKTVIQESDRLTREFPQSILPWNLLGAALRAQGNLEEAIAVFNKALLIKPDYVDAHNNIGAALAGQGKADEAIAAFNRALLIKPNYAEAHYNIGTTLAGQGKLEKAILAYNKALLIKPDYAEAHNNIGSALADQGKSEEAIAAYNKALLIKPDYAEAHNNMGNALIDQGKLERAIAAYNKALLFNPDYAEVHSNIGSALANWGEPEEAIAAFNKALLIKPDYAEVHYNKGVAFKAQGKPEEAVAAYKEALLIKPDYAEVHYNLSILKKYAYFDPQIVQMEKLYADASINIESRCHLCFALAKSSEDLGKLEEAFRYLKEGNALRKRVLNYDIVQDKKIFYRIKETANSFKNFSSNVSGEGNLPTPILILGMPRSGSTLVEQIISNHSKVSGADELHFLKMFGSPLAEGKVEVSGDNLRAVRKQYLNAIKSLSSGLPFVTDKMPGNFFYIGLICSALPEAKIIHVKRNPASTCWSNFKHYFSAKGLGYSCDLLDVVHYYQMYEELMLYWEEQYPGKIYHLDYEQLTTDQEYETKELIQYLGVNWEDACLYPEENKRYVKTASNLQVRKKVYKGSSEQWKKFEKYLNKAFDGLPN
jgi:tetratricopeptide (TPR) repeat protein